MKTVRFVEKSESCLIDIPNTGDYMHGRREGGIPKKQRKTPDFTYKYILKSCMEKARFPLKFEFIYGVSS